MDTRALSRRTYTNLRHMAHSTRYFLIALSCLYNQIMTTTTTQSKKKRRS